jgi:hypothetical protein
LARVSSVSSDIRYHANLELEPVNTDPVVSPKKARRGLLPEKPQKPPTVSFATEHHAPAPASNRQAPKELDVMDPMDDDMNTVAPKTPAIIEIFSPPSQPSTERPVAKDTPPPTNLASSTTSTGMEPVGRVARRARAVVNYAEPSLISKMRRPTKELVDAVGKDGRPIPGSMYKKEEDKAADQWQPKTGPTTDSLQTTQRDEAPSPLGSKTGPAMEVESMATENLRNVRKSIIRPSLPGPEALPKKSNVLPAKTIVERSTATLDPRRKKIDDIKEAELAVYDFKDSSPLSQSSEESRSTKSISHRRHSSMTDVRSKLEDAKTTATGRSSSNLVKAKADVAEDVLARSSRSIARRKSMMI